MSSPPYAKGRPTSKAAADSVAAETAAMRGKVLNVIRASGREGRTCDEVEAILLMSHQTTSARVNELMNEKVIVDSGRVRPTRSKRNAIIWVYFEFGEGEAKSKVKRPSKKQIQKAVGDLRRAWDAGIRSPELEAVGLWLADICKESLP